ncbi:MAG: sensor histidine kinase [Actinobacteria bacterium]|nr:MAG: sensor histidine kinase [Actinomycetota bacterium]
MGGVSGDVGRRAFLLQSVLIDLLLTLSVMIIAGTGLAALVVPVPRYVFVTAVAGITLIALLMLAGRFITRPDHLQARQSQQILEIANRSLTHLRRGLDEETAGAVCRLILEQADHVAAVAITDTERILGFAGAGEDHHTTGGPILTRATGETIECDDYRVLSSHDEIGCLSEKCPLEAAIVMPLRMRARPVGTLKFYYTTPRLLNETQVTMVGGLADLLSTQLELSELDRQTELATRMELQALQAQINPHFLFNTINTIASLVRTDPSEARDLLREFATFYRRTLETGDSPVPLARELEYVHSYLRFETARFPNRIKVVEDIEPAALDVNIPAFVVQPLVENCIKHGMRARGVLTVRIDARLSQGRLTVRVADDGVGMAPDVLAKVMEPGFGTGLGIALGNVDDRLRGLYGPASGLVVHSTADAGTTVTLTVIQDQAEGIT